MKTLRNFMDKGAVFSECRRYRYLLWRVWNRLPGKRCVMFVGLNPSTADETEDDPTIRRCIGFAQSWGFDGLYMLNAYAFRATDPKVMLAAADPVGPDNDKALAFYGYESAFVVVAWGARCPLEREREVLGLLGRGIHCFGLTKQGRPKHPLYLWKHTKPQPFETSNKRT